MDIMKFISEHFYIIVPVLFVIGYIIKTSDTIKSKYIPLVLLIIGVVFGIAVALQQQADVTTGIIQGVLCAGGAVLAHQIPKQLKKEE